MTETTAMAETASPIIVQVDQNHDMVGIGNPEEELYHPLEALIGRNIGVYMTPEDGKLFNDLIDLVLKNGETIYCEKMVKFLDGRIIDSIVKVFCEDFDDRRVFFCVYPRGSGTEKGWILDTYGPGGLDYGDIMCH